MTVNGPCVAVRRKWTRFMLTVLNIASTATRKGFAVEWINRELRDKHSELMDEYRKLNVQIDSLTAEKEEVSSNMKEINIVISKLKK